MTHTKWNTSNQMTGIAARNRRKRRACGGCQLVRLFLALVLLGFPVGARAAEEQAGPFLLTSSDRTLKDIAIEAKVRRALQQDAQLRPLNLGVHVSSGVAYLSGPVPTAELKERAAAIARRIEDVLAVSAKELYISTSDQGGQRLSILLQDDQPMKTRSASPGSSLRGSSDSPAAVAGGPRGSPAAAAGGPRSSPAAGATHLTANPHPASPAISLLAAIAQLQREARFQQIRTRVQGTTVYVFPGDTASDDAMLFAQIVRRLPGVQHVVMTSNPR